VEFEGICIADCESHRFRGGERLLPASAIHFEPDSVPFARGKLP
jgi:hypothetical protein